VRKAERLFQIMTLLRSRRRVVTAATIAAELQVSERTVYRDMQALSLSGVPIESETGVGYTLKSGFSIPPLMFEADELEALLLGVRMVQGWSGPQLGAAADRALQKIQAVLPDALHQTYVQEPEWLLVPDFNRDLSSPHSDQIRESIKARQVLDVGYRDEAGGRSERAVWPLGLVFWGRVWTLVAWCELRQDYRMFRLDRIQSLQPLERHFQPTEEINLQVYWNRQVEG